MVSQTDNRVFIIFLICCFSLLLPTTSLRIENCVTNWVTTILGSDPQNTLRYNGRFDAELAWNRTYGVASVKRATLSLLQYVDEPMNNFTLDINSLKGVRIQRLVEYDRKEFIDIAKSQCSLGFLYDNAISLDIPYALEDAIISHTEKCIEDKICDFDPESHRIGDDIHVKSMSRKEKYQTTSQETINAAVDFVVDRFINDLIKANKTLLSVPQFDLSVFPITLSSSGGIVNILQYVKRQEDLSFHYEGHRYVINTLLSLVGGDSELHDVSVTSSLGNFADGKLPVNMTGATLHIKVAFDYDKTPCEISVTDIALNISPDQVDFSSLKIKFWGVEVINVDTILKTLFVKSLTVNAIAGQLAGLLKRMVERQTCEDYRDLLFKLEGKF